jgi:hypothetical protein
LAAGLHDHVLAVGDEPLEGEGDRGGEPGPQAGEEVAGDLTLAAVDARTWQTCASNFLPVCL